MYSIQQRSSCVQPLFTAVLSQVYQPCLTFTALVDVGVEFIQILLIDAQVLFQAIGLNLCQVVIPCIVCYSIHDESRLAGIDIGNQIRLDIGQLFCIIHAHQNLGIHILVVHIGGIVFLDPVEAILCVVGAGHIDTIVFIQDGKRSADAFCFTNLYRRSISQRRMQEIRSRIKTSCETMLSGDNTELAALNERMSKDISVQIERRLKELAEQVEIPL